MPRPSRLRLAASLLAISFVPALASAAEVQVKTKDGKDVTLNVPDAGVPHPGLKKLGWKLACQFWTFREYTAFETIDILHAMGVHHCEFYPGQALSPDKKDVHVGPDITPQRAGTLLRPSLPPLQFFAHEAEARAFLDDCRARS